MPRQTRRLSKTGKEIVRRAKKKKRQQWESEETQASIKESPDDIWRRKAREHHPQNIIISEASLKRFLRRKNPIEADTFIALCKAVEVNPDEVTEFDDLDVICIGDLPESSDFYGRTKALEQLQQWLDNGKRLIIVHGRAGIGKTTLAYQVMHLSRHKFDFLIWVSLASEMPLSELISELTSHISKGKDQKTELSNLKQCLIQHKCLVVLDNWETIMPRTGQYRTGYQDYSELLEQISSTGRLKSCFVLLSLEKPQSARIMRAGQAIQSLQLEGLNYEEDREILRAEGLTGTEAELRSFIQIYNNPLILKLVAEMVRTVYRGRVSVLVEDGVSVFGNTADIADILKKEFEREFKRLSKLEQDIIYWLAIWRDPVSLEKLQQSITAPVGISALTCALSSLIAGHSIVKLKELEAEDSSEYYLDRVTLQQATGRFIEQTFQQLDTAIQQQVLQGSEFFVSHAL
jgi:DNA-binding Xre family transcriptional regulator